MGKETIYTKHAPVFVLWACRETGVLDALRRGDTDPESIAEETGITERAATIGLAALVDLGYAQAHDGTFRPTERLQVFDPETPVTDRGILPHRLDSLENYMNLPEVMKSGTVGDVSGRELRNYVGGMAVIGDSTVRAGVTAAERVHPRPRRVLDVGGGIGRFSREFSRRGANVTLLEAPEIVDIVRPHLGETDIELVAGDALEDLPGGFDLVFSSRLTVSFSPAENERYFENVYEALESGGTIVDMEYVRGRSDAAAMFAVHMLTMSETGNTYPPDRYHSWLDGAGFRDSSVSTIPGTDFQAIAGKP